MAFHQVSIKVLLALPAKLLRLANSDLDFGCSLTAEKLSDARVQIAVDMPMEKE
jgi:hypothetical protein